MNRMDEQEPFHFPYDVFLSFRGEDTRRNFIQSLYAALHLRGIRTFIDNKGIQPGCEITPSLFRAILDSAMVVVVISRNYAKSRWCLEELVKIIDCGRLILPVFYGVNPGDVREQKGPFEGDFRNYEKRFGDGSEQVLRWRKAFEKVGGIAGWVSNDWEEAKLIQHLVGVILTKLGNTPLLVANPFDINIDVPDATLSMHDQLRDMGRQYVGQENQDLGKLSRLWDCEDIMPARKYYKGTRSIKAIILNFVNYIKAIILNFVNYGIQLLRSKKSFKSSSRRSFNLSPAEEKDGVLEKPGLGEDLSFQVYGFSKTSETTKSLRGQKWYTKSSVMIFNSLPLQREDYHTICKEIKALV